VAEIFCVVLWPKFRDLRGKKMKRIAEFVTRFPRTIIAVTIGITLIFGYFAKDLKVDINVYGYLPQEDPAVKLSTELEEKFGGVNILLVMLETEDVFNYATLTRIRNITERIEEDENVSRVLTLTNITEVKSIEDGIEVSYLIDEIPEDKEKLLALRKKVLQDPLYRGAVVSKDGKFASLVVYLNAFADYDLLLKNVRSILTEEKGPEKVYLGGMPLINDTIARITYHDLKWLTPLTIILLILILFYSFHNLKGVFLPLLGVGISLIWTLGLISVTGHSLSSMGSAIPPLLMAIGCAYGIHIVSRYCEEIPKTGLTKTTIVQTMQGVGIPVVMAGVTTMVGFLSLLVSRLTIIRDFGFFISFGIGSALLISLLFIPAVLFWSPAQKIEAIFEKRKKEKNLILQFLDKITSFVLNRTGWILVFTGITILLALVGLPRLSTESNLISYFKKNSAIRVTEKITRKNFGGSTLLEIFVQGDLKDPEVLTEMEKMQKYLDALPGVKNPISIVNLLKKMNFVLNDNNPEYDCLPTSREAIAQYLLLYSMGEGGEFVSTLINEEATEGLITARVGSLSSGENKVLLRKIEKYLKENINGEKIKVQVAGAPAVFEAVDRQIKKSQLTSMGFALVVVFILLAIEFRTLVGGVICIIPILLTILFNFAVMSYTGIPLDIATSIIASMAIGIGIDYTIHFTSRYKAEFARTGEIRKSVKTTLETTGQAILYNAVAVEAGFLVICLSRLVINQHFGALNALTMVFSSLSAIIVLPALLLTIKPEFITKGRLLVIWEALSEKREGALGELKKVMDEFGKERLEAIGERLSRRRKEIRSVLKKALAELKKKR